MVTGGNGYLYRVRTDGKLLGYRHTGWTNGSVAWDDFGVIGDSFESFVHVVADNNIVYGINPQGDLRWYRFRGYPTGTGEFAPGSGKVIGTDWGFSAIGAAGLGVIHATGFDGKLYWYKHLDPTGGAVSWADRKQVGSGWL